MKPLGRDLAIGLSLANLLMVRVWAELLAVGRADAYYLKIGSREIVAAALVVLLTGAIFAALAQLRHRGTTGRNVADAGLAFVLLVLLSNLGPLKSPGALILARMWRAGQVVHLALIVLAAIAAAYAAFRWRPRARRALATLLLALSPFAGLMIARAAYYAIALKPDALLADRTPPIGAGAEAPAGPRVVVLLFDAMGRGLSIEHRPGGIDMPALDRFRAQALDATNVAQAGASTKIAVPGMMTGRRVAKSKPAGHDQLRLTFADGTVAEWDDVDSLFREARALGGRSTVVGWYHPYCRLIEEDLDECSWHPSSTAGGRTREAGLSGAMADAAAAMFPYTVYRRRHAQTYQAIRADAERAVTRRGRGFTFVHVNAPHHPYVYDRGTGEMTVWSFSPAGYLDGLALADRTLAELREAMERAGTWDSSTVVVLADHFAPGASKSFKVKDREVPFLVKWPGQSEGLLYEKPFLATALHGLMRATLRGEVADAAAGAAWLDANIASHDVPTATAAKGAP